MDRLLLFSLCRLRSPIHVSHHNYLKKATNFKLLTSITYVEQCGISSYSSNMQTILYNNYRKNLMKPGLLNFSSEPLGERKLATSNSLKSLSTDESIKKSQITRLKQAVKDYGSTVIVFHVGLSLASLGACYIAISNGVDTTVFLSTIGFSESSISSKLAAGGSTFVMAYALHKLFAPVRIAITLSATPFIVRHLRKIGILKIAKTLKQKDQ